MRILVIDNNIDPACWGAADLRRLCCESSAGATVEVRRAPQGDLPGDFARYDRVVISGSMTSAMADAPWIAGLHEAIRGLVDRGKPVLGVCYGHQAIARALGGVGSVRRGEKAEFGWTRIEQVGSSPLLAKLPERFYSFSAHFEEVASLPPGASSLARSEWCAIQAFGIEGKPVFGIQFHPEKDLEDASRTFQSCRKKGAPKELLRPKEGPRLYDPKVGQTIFGNFLGL